LWAVCVTLPRRPAGAVAGCRPGCARGSGRRPDCPPASAPGEGHTGSTPRSVVSGLTVSRSDECSRSPAVKQPPQPVVIDDFEASPTLDVLDECGSTASAGAGVAGGQVGGEDARMGEQELAATWPPMRQLRFASPDRRGRSGLRSRTRTWRPHRDWILPQPNQTSDRQLALQAWTTSLCVMV